MSSPKPTILHVIDTTGPGGAETVFLDLAERMHIDGYDSLALIQGPGWVEDQLIKKDIKHKVLKPYGLFSIPYYIEIARLLKENNVKYVQAHLLGSALTFSIIALLCRIPVSATFHGQVDLDPKERFITIKRFLLRKGLKKVVAVSGQLASYLVSRKLIRHEQVEVIHNGIDVSNYSKTPHTDLRKQLGLNDDSLLVGSIGNIRPAKDYPNLLSAAAILLKRMPSVHFIIAGHTKEPLYGSLLEQVKSFAIERNIHFLGFINDTPDFLAQLDVFALSSKEEGFSISTLEAMASGIPIVATKCGGPEEIVRHGLDGILVDINDPEQLARGLEMSLLKELNYRLSAKERVTRDFGISTSVDKYQRLANHLLLSIY